MAADPLAYTVTVALADALAAELEVAGSGRPKRIVRITPGQIADDKCDCGGQLALSVPRIYGSRTPPIEFTDDAEVAACGIPYLCFEVDVRLSRCVAVSDDQGDPPPAAKLERQALEFERDRMALWTALRCTLLELEQDDSTGIAGFIVRPVVADGPSGACMALTCSATWWTPGLGACECAES